MPKYVVGTMTNYYMEATSEFSPDLIVTADTPYSWPTLVEPFDPTDERNTKLAVETFEWIRALPADLRWNLWEIWTSKTAVQDMEGQFVLYSALDDPHKVPPRDNPSLTARRLLNRG